METQISQFIIPLGVFIFSVALTATVLRFLIPVLASHKMGQKILDIGPRWHKSKEGTPTMGGLAFLASSLPIMAAVAVFAVVRGWNDHWSILMLSYGLAFLNGCIGIFDDYEKLSHKQNEGLSASRKFLLQLVVAGVYLFSLRVLNLIDTSLFLPYLGIEIELGVFYYAVALLLITGIVNAVNLTDGVDGLASGVTAVVAAFFGFVAFRFGSGESVVAEGVLPALTLGVCLGFLVYNYYPARVFMGDTGSLFLGGAVIGMAFIQDNPMIILIAGLLYFIECLSVMLQVTYFKLTGGKRLFRMAPIHHHFEKGGWSERKVVAVFSVFTLVCCVIAYFGI